jgi:type IV pilus assembly protein PilM
MTPWNPRNPSSPSDADVPESTTPSASFDPARTGDPSPAGTGGIDLGVGYAGGGAVGLPKSNPIGFAPPADPVRDLGTAPRYRTELSFKRHHAPIASMASAGSDGGSVDDLGRRSVDLGEPSSEHEAPADAPAQASEPDVETMPQADADVVGDEPAEEPWMPEAPVEAAEEKVPFYKRELSLRRRKKESMPESILPVVPLAFERTQEKAVTESPVEDEPVVEEPVAEEPVVEEPVAEEPVVEEPVVEEPVAEEPVAEEPVVDEPVAEEIAEEPVSEEPVVGAPLQEEPPADESVAEGGDSGSSILPFARKHNGSQSTAQKSKRGRGHKAKTMVGLKIGTSQIAAAVVTEIDGRSELVQLARRPIESGLVVDGEIRDAEALAHQLKAFFDENNLPKKSVRIGLASNRIGVRTFDIAGIEDEVRFDNAVRFRAHEVLPVAQHESVLDYRVLAERPAENGETSRRILLVVAPRDQIEPYVNVAKQAGIHLAGLDLEALSLLRAFVDPVPAVVEGTDPMATVIVSIGHESTTLLVAGGGACEFTRVFDWGGGALQDAVMQELEVPHAEAATILRHLSLTGPGLRYEPLDEDDRRKATEAVRARLSPVARELVSSLQFYQTQENSLGIGEIVITGGTSQLEGLGEALHRMIGVNVRVGDPLARVSLAHELGHGIEATIGSLAVPIGLAIEDERTRSVNLLPSDAQETTRRRPSLAKIAVPVAVAVPIVALGFMFVSAHGQVGTAQTELDAVTAEINSLPKPKRPVIDASLQGAQAQRAQAVASVLVNRVAWDSVLHDVSRVLPANVWLTVLQAQVASTASPGSVPVAATTAGVAAAPTGAHIEGYTYTQTDVAQLLSRLSTLPTLTNVTLTSSIVEVNGKKSVVHFQIAADLTGGSR